MNCPGPRLLLLGLTVTGTANTAAWLMAGLTVSAAVGGPVFGAMLDRSRYPGRLLALAVILAGLGYVPWPSPPAWSTLRSPVAGPRNCLTFSAGRTSAAPVRWTR
jgi:MFS family permease